MAIFDIRDAKQFLHTIEQRFIRYQASRVKSTEDLLFIVMGLNHLREWIAPGFKPKCFDPLTWPPEDTRAKEFSRKVYEDSDHEMVRELCNGMKHVRKSKHTTSAAYDSTMAEWPDVDSVLDFGKGPPTEHFVDGEPIEPIIQRVIDLYKTWFTR